MVANPGIYEPALTSTIRSSAHILTLRTHFAKPDHNEHCFVNISKNRYFKNIYNYTSTNFP